jgi:hypothetical protein
MSKHFLTHQVDGWPTDMSPLHTQGSPTQFEHLLLISWHAQQHL